MINSFASKRLTAPERILIAQLGGISEMIHAIPILIALRVRFPKTEIAWLADSNHSAILQRHWTLDRLMLVRKDWMSSYSEISMVRQRLQVFAPDVTIDMQGILRSAFACWLSGAPFRIGFGGKIGREGSRWLNNCIIKPMPAHTIEQNMQMLEPFGIAGASIDFDIPELDVDWRATRNLLNREGLHGNFAIINVGGKTPQNRWIPARFADVAQYLLEQWNLPSLILWGSNDEKSLAEMVTSLSEGAAILAPPISIHELISLARKSTLFISGDTGPLHLAAAIGAHCIGLCQAGKAEQVAPFGPKNQTVCPSLSKINKDRSVNGITLEQVCEACDAILADILNPSGAILPSIQHEQFRSNTRAA
ncbi:MAG: glycosyltransferase family 9 protein [Thermoguttaceae bacterium]